MYTVLFAPQSQRDLRKLRHDLAQSAGTHIANAYVEEIIAFCEALGLSPHRGEERAHLATGVRSIGFRRRTSIYFRISPEQQTVVIARVMYAGRMR